MEIPIADRLKEILRRIETKALACGRNPADIKLVAVSKTKPAEDVRQAASAGADIFGENYIQEARKKIETLWDLDVKWHFIGHLQSNKAKYAVRLFDMIHSVDSLKLAKALDKEAAKINKIQAVLVQVNISGEETKSGVHPEDTIELLQQISCLEHVQVKGLMTMPPFFDDPLKAKPFFRQLRQLARKAIEAEIANLSMEELSMGMTGDFETAIEEGATLVRIGTAIFGKRG